MIILFNFSRNSMSSTQFVLFRLRSPPSLCREGRGGSYSIPSNSTVKISAA